MVCGSAEISGEPAWHECMRLGGEPTDGWIAASNGVRCGLDSTVDRSTTQCNAMLVLLATRRGAARPESMDACACCVTAI